MRCAALAILVGSAAIGAAAQDEVPFIATPDQVTVAMLELAGVGARDHVIDLGSGDGRIVITAARRFGATGLGVEIVPDLVRESRVNARAAGVHGRAEFREQDLFITDLARATVVTMYLLPEVNLQLRSRLLALAPGTRIVSHDWDMGDWLPDRALTLEVPDKAIGREKKSRVLLWVVPAQVHGRWCRGNVWLEVTQRFQRFSATLEERPPAAAGATQTTRAAPTAPTAPTAVFDGRIEGLELRAEGGLATPTRMRLEGETLLLEQAGGAAAGHTGSRYRRAGAADTGSCPAT